MLKMKRNVLRQAIIATFLNWLPMLTVYSYVPFMNFPNALLGLVAIRGCERLRAGPCPHYACVITSASVFVNKNHLLYELNILYRYEAQFFFINR